MEVTLSPMVMLLSVSKSAHAPFAMAVTLYATPSCMRMDGISIDLFTLLTIPITVAVLVVTSYSYFQ